jgi:hypothetical protein
VARQNIFTRFLLSGIAFTILGPCLFWIAYPIGPFLAAALAEVTVHAVRFLAFRTIVFPANMGYVVSFPRYLVSALPLTLAGFTSVALFGHALDRTALTLVSALISVVIGFLWSRFVYSQPAKRS